MPFQHLTDADRARIRRAMPADYDAPVVEEVIDRILATHLEAADAPETCDMKQGEPCDFAWCETHDTTFPLGGVCKFNGRRMWEVYAGEADEQRGLKVRAEMQAEQAAVQVEAVRELLAFYTGNYAEGWYRLAARDIDNTLTRATGGPACTCASSGFHDPADADCDRNQPTEVTVHNHVTRDIRPPGECPACDRYHQRHPEQPQ